MGKYNKKSRMPSNQELQWIYERLVLACKSNVIFSVEKILPTRALLHVKSENIIFSVYLDFNGNFQKPKKITD